MSVENRSKLLRMTIRNIGCIGNEGVDIALDNIVCLVEKIMPVSLLFSEPMN